MPAFCAPPPKRAFAIADPRNVCNLKRFHSVMDGSGIFGYRGHSRWVEAVPLDKPKMTTLDCSAEIPSSGADVLALLANAEALRPLSSGLRSSRMKALRLIQAAGRRGISQAALASEMGVSHAAVSRLCDELEAGAVIVRTTHQFDRRMKTLHLSETGVKQVEHCDRATLAKAAGAIPLLNQGGPASVSDLFHQMVMQMQSNPCALLCQHCLIGGC